MKNLNNYAHSGSLPHDTIVKAYINIIHSTIEFISKIENVSVRPILERQDTPNLSKAYIIHELINPLLYLRLECLKDQSLAIHYGYEQGELADEYYSITSAFIRSIYRYTSKENTEVDIEDCVHTDWVIINCDELFEYMLDRDRNHSSKIIPLKLEVI